MNNLHIASKYSTVISNEKLLELLKIHNVNTPDKKGITPLHYACRYCYSTSTLDTVKLLLEAGADVNIKDMVGYTVLMCVTVCSFTKIISLLLELNNILPNLQDNKGKTALMYAVRHPEKIGNIERNVEIFLKCDKVDVNLQDNDGVTALHIACKFSNTTSTVNTVKLLLSNTNSICNPNIQNRLGSTALHDACVSLSEETVKLLLELELTNPNIQDNNGRTPLHLLLIKLRDETLSDFTVKSIENTVQTLISCNRIDVNVQDNEGVTPIMLSVNSINIITTMLDSKKCNLRLLTKDRCSVLHRCIKYCTKGDKQLLIVNLLLKAAPDIINIQDVDGCSVLYLICRTYNIHTVQILHSLLNANCNVNLINRDNNTALSLVLQTHVSPPQSEIRNTVIELILNHKYCMLDDSFIAREINTLQSRQCYKQFIENIAVKRYVKNTNSLKLKKFIPQRKAQIECQPNSNKVKLIKLLFDVKNGVSTDILYNTLYSLDNFMNMKEFYGLNTKEKFDLFINSCNNDS